MTFANISAISRNVLNEVLSTAFVLTTTCELLSSYINIEQSYAKQHPCDVNTL